MILAIAIVVTLLTAILFFSDFFEDWGDFRHFLSGLSPADDRVRFNHDPEGSDDNGFSDLKFAVYFLLVIGSGLLVYALFHYLVGPNL